MEMLHHPRLSEKKRLAQDGTYLRDEETPQQSCQVKNKEIEAK